MRMLYFQGVFTFSLTGNRSKLTWVGVSSFSRWKGRNYSGMGERSSNWRQYTAPLSTRGITSPSFRALAMAARAGTGELADEGRIPDGPVRIPPVFPEGKLHRHVGEVLAVSDFHYQVGLPDTREVVRGQSLVPGQDEQFVPAEGTDIGQPHAFGDTVDFIHCLSPGMFSQKVSDVRSCPLERSPKQIILGGDAGHRYMPL